MFKGTTAIEPLKIIAPPASPKPVTEDELHAIVDRLVTARDIFRQNQELREVLSRREGETQALRRRNAELEEIMREFAPMLLNAATSMGLAAKNENPHTPPQRKEVFVSLERPR